MCAEALARYTETVLDIARDQAEGMNPEDQAALVAELQERLAEWDTALANSRAWRQLSGR